MSPKEIEALKALQPGLPLIDEPAVQLLLASARIKKHRKGDLIIIAGTDSYAPAILLEGLIRVYFLSPDGSDVTNLFIFEKTFYGSDFLTMKKAGVCNFEALEDCTSVVFDAAGFKAALRGNPDLLLIYTGILERSMNRKILRENSLITRSAAERYLDLKKEYPGIEERVTQKHIASYLGISPVSLSRIRRELAGSKEYPENV